MTGQKAYWESVSAQKKFSTPFQTHIFEKWVSKKGRILDIGCGYGRTLNQLREHGFTNVYGVDFSEGMIRRGLKMNPFLKMAKAGGAGLPFADSTFDAVILIAVLTCIATDSGQRQVLDEVARVLKREGIFYVNDFMINRDHRNIARYEKNINRFGAYGIFKIPEGAVVRHHTQDYFEKITKNFAKINFEPVIYTTMNGNRSNGFYYLGSKKPVSKP